MADSVARIVLTAEDKTAAALASLRSGLAGVTGQAGALRNVFAGLVPALTFTGAAAFIKNINDGVDALNDLKDATGSSIENISALEDVAARTGTSFETVGTSLIKLNQALSQATPDSDVSKALKAIGLEANELKKLDPAEALRRTAVALSGFADDGNKARTVQELFGKSLREVAPLLNDLAKQTELVATVTSQQAEEAEKFNRQLFELQKNATDAGRAMAGVLIPAINQVFSDIRSFGAKSELADAAADVINLKKELDGLNTRQASPYFFVGDVSGEIEEVTRKLEEAKRRFREMDQQVTGFGASNASTSDGPKTDDRPSVVFDTGADKALAEANKKFLAENEKARATDLAGWVRYAEERVNADFESAKQIADNQIKLNDELLDARQTMMQQWFQSIDQEQEDAIAAGRTIIDAAEEDAKRLQSVGRDLGFTFSSAFEDAVIGGKSFSQVLKGIGDDILRIILRRSVTEPLAGAISGFNFGSLFGGGGGSETPIDGYAKGGVFNSPSLSAYSGGVYDSPQLFAFAKGAGVFGEAGAEAIMPLTRTPSGDLGVRALSDGGSSNVVVNVIEAPGRGGQQSTRQEGGMTIVDVLVEQVKTAVAGDIMSGSGPVPAALGRTYGLNRVAGAY